MSAYAAGANAWPELALDRERFEAFVAARGHSAIELNAADLYLACACAHGLPKALAAFERHYLARLPALVLKLRLDAVTLDELAQSLREKLFAGSRPKIAEFSGRGPLLAWLRVVAVRAGVDLLRATSQPQARDRDDELTLPATAATPEMQALRARYQPRFESAFRSALALLTTDERNLLRLHLVDGLTMEELAPLFRVNRSTIFRRFNACTRALYEMMRDQLAAELAISTAEFDSLAQLVRSQLELNLTTLLASRP